MTDRANGTETPEAENGRLVRPPATAAGPEGVHLLMLDDDELFTLSCLANLTVGGINWQGGDADRLELRFRQGKISLKAKAAALAREAG